MQADQTSWDTSSKHFRAHAQLPDACACGVTLRIREACSGLNSRFDPNHSETCNRERRFTCSPSWRLPTFSSSRISGGPAINHCLSFSAKMRCERISLSYGFGGDVLGPIQAYRYPSQSLLHANFGFRTAVPCDHSHSAHLGSRCVGPTVRPMTHVADLVRRRDELV